MNSVSYNKISLLTLLMVLYSIHSIAQTNKEQLFAKTTKDVIAKIISKNSAGLTKYIDKSRGVTLIYKMGKFYTYKKYKTINYKDNVYPNFLFFHDKISVGNLNYDSLPEYNCETKSWNKTGLFTDTSTVNHLLTNTAIAVKKYLYGTITQKNIDDFAKLELISRRIVLNAADGKSLIFYLSYINKKWILTTIDRATTDCGT